MEYSSSDNSTFSKGVLVSMLKAFKKAMVGLTAVSLLSLPAPSLAATPIHFAINGMEQHSSVAPYLKNGYTYVPLRAVFQALGYKIKFQGEGFPIVAKKGDQTVTMRIGTLTADVNGQEHKLAAPIEVVNNSTMVPVRFVADVSGAKVKWDFVKNAVNLITSAGEQVLNLRLNDANTLLLDPSVNSTRDNETLLNQVNEGLVRLGQDGKIVPGVAKTWTVSADRKTYTFNLRENAKWSDGSIVTAHDFEYAWKRALEPNGSLTAAYLKWLAGSDAYQSGTGTLDEVGVTAKNNHTLEVTLERPLPYFLETTALPTFFPLKKSFVEQQQTAFGSSAESTLYNGPFKVTSVTPSVTTLEKNEFYWDRLNVQLQKANLYFFPGANTDAIDRYGMGLLDRVHVRSDNLKRFKDHAELSRVERTSTSFLLLNNKNTALQNKKIRQALSYVIDVNKIGTKVMEQGHPAANTFVPPGITNENGEPFHTLTDDLINRQENQSKAKTLLEEGLKEIGLAEFPTLLLTIANSNLDFKIGRYLQAEWNEKLGIEVELKPISFNKTSENAQNGTYDILLTVWAADFNDPLSHLELWQSDPVYYKSFYSNKTYDDLIQKAQTETDSQKRLQYLHQAEEILLQDMPIIPLSFKTDTYLTKSYVKGLAPRAIGPDFDLKYTYIQGK